MYEFFFDILISVDIYLNERVSKSHVYRHIPVTPGRYSVFDVTDKATHRFKRKLIGQAISEMHLGRLEEAEAALQQAREKDAKSADVMANAIVLSAIQGKDIAESVTYVLRC